MVDPLSYFPFHPVLHNWCNKGCGMYYHVWCLKRDPSLRIAESSPLSGGTRCSSVVRGFAHGAMGRPTSQLADDIATAVRSQLF